MTLHPPAFIYYYRQSPAVLAAWSGPVVNVFDPPMTVSGMTLIALDMDGKLYEFVAVPPHLDTEPKHESKFDWTFSLPLRGSNPAKFTSADRNGYRRSTQTRGQPGRASCRDLLTSRSGSRRHLIMEGRCSSALCIRGTGHTARSTG